MYCPFRPGRGRTSLDRISFLARKDFFPVCKQVLDGLGRVFLAYGSFLSALSCILGPLNQILRAHQQIFYALGQILFRHSAFLAFWQFLRTLRISRDTFLRNCFRQRTADGRLFRYFLHFLSQHKYFPEQSQRPLNISLLRHGAQHFRKGLHYGVHTLCEIMGEISVGGHLVHIGLVHGHLEFVKVDYIRDGSLGKIVDLPVDLLQHIFVHRQGRRHQLFRHLHGSLIHRKPCHIQRFQHIGVRGDIGEQGAQGQGASVALDLKCHVLPHFDVHAPVHSGVQDHVVGEFDCHLTAVPGHYLPADRLPRHQGAHMAAHAFRLGRCHLGTPLRAHLP